MRWGINTLTPPSKLAVGQQLSCSMELHPPQCYTVIRLYNYNPTIKACVYVQLHGSPTSSLCVCFCLIVQRGLILTVASGCFCNINITYYLSLTNYGINILKGTWYRGNSSQFLVGNEGNSWESLKQTPRSILFFLKRLISSHVVTGFLFCYHIHGRAMLDFHVHQLLLVAIFGAAFCTFLEVFFRGSIVLEMLRTSLCILQGSWLWQVSLCFQLFGFPRLSIILALPLCCFSTGMLVLQMWPTVHSHSGFYAQISKHS